MNQTVASVSEDGLTLEEWVFKVTCLEDSIRLQLVIFRRWRRSCPKESTPWGDKPANQWRIADFSGKSDMMGPPEIPESVKTEARQWINSKINFQ